MNNVKAIESAALADTAEISEPIGERISNEDIAFIALEIGEHIQRSGGEISRVEDTIKRICKAYGARHVDVFALTSIIILSVNFGEKTVTRTRRITKGCANNFSRLSRLNNLSRRVCKELPDKQDVLAAMEEIYKTTVPFLPLFLLAHVLTALGFCIYFGGTVVEALFAGAIALLMHILHKIISGPNMNHIMAKVIICFFGGICTILITYAGNSMGLVCHSDKIMIGTIMNVIPGVAFTNSLRDLLGGDLMTGILRFSEVLIDTVAIGCGYAISFVTLPKLVQKATATGNLEVPDVLWHILGATVCTVGLVLMYNLEKKSMVFAVFGAMMACSIFEFYVFYNGNVFVGALLSALAVAFYGDIMAHVLKTPTTVLLIPGIVPMVPGGLLFNTMLSVLDQNKENAGTYGTRALLIALGLTVGIISATFIFRTFWSIVKKYKQSGREKFNSVLEKIKKN